MQSLTACARRCSFDAEDTPAAETQSAVRFGLARVVLKAIDPSDLGTAALLNHEINAALASPVINARLADLGLSPLVLSPADFGELVGGETEKWSKVIKFAGIKPE
jgi:hypothetical protein